MKVERVLYTNRQQFPLKACFIFMSREQLIHEALSLPQKEREMLAEELLVSVDRISSQEIETLWKAEAERRLDAMLDGSSIPVDGPEFMKKLRQSRG